MQKQTVETSCPKVERWRLVVGVLQLQAGLATIDRNNPLEQKTALDIIKKIKKREQRINEIDLLALIS